jgi:hypothetical protein
MSALPLTEVECTKESQGSRIRHLALVVLLAASASSAQQVKLALPELAQPASVVAAPAPYVAEPYKFSPPPQHTVDARYYLINGVHLEMMLLDVQMTRHCINAGTCKEGNPLMPSSLGGQLGLGFAFVGGGIVDSYYLKRRHSRFWWIAPVVGIAAHGVGIASGIRER